MKTTKLKLNKFRVAKLTGVQHVRGGAPHPDTYYCQTFTGTTDPAAAQNPNCILTSKQVLEEDVPPTAIGGTV